MPGSPVNLHQLELFYHVARCGGITAAARQMPYGIQQPAISTQISALEASLDDTRLFHRRPFELTAAGRRLYDFVSGFFDRLDMVADEVAQRTRTSLRLAAPGTILRDHLPHLLAEIRQAHPALELSLTDAGQRGCEELLGRDEIDLAVCDLMGRPATGLKSEVLVELPLMLLLPKGIDAERPFEEIPASLPLISMPPQESLTRVFQKGLDQLGIGWKSSIEVSSTDLVQIYVANGLGAGLTVHVPGQSYASGVSTKILHELPKLVIAALWRDRLTPLAAELLERVRQMAVELFSSHPPKSGDRG